MEEKQRYGYLDLLKVIAIMCVCLYHFPIIHHTAYARPFPAHVLALRYFRGFNVVCVPLFMMVNGALVLNRPFVLKKHAARCLWLLAGVYIWYLITMALGLAAKSGWRYVAENWRGIVISAQYLYGYGGVETSHLWFVHMLTAIYLLVPLLYAALDSGDDQLRKGMTFFLGAMGLLSFLLKDISHVRAAVPVLRGLDLSGLETVNPFRGMYGAMLTYFILGGILHRHRARMLSVPWLWCAALGLGGSAALFAEWYLMTIRTESMYDIVFGGYNCLPALAMTFSLFVAAAKLEETLCVKGMRFPSVVALIGRNTLAVYYSHWILGLTALQAVHVQGSFMMNLIKAAAMVLAGALIGEGLRRIPGLRRLV